jgi:hypothetical protein
LAGADVSSPQGAEASSNDFAFSHEGDGVESVDEAFFLS